MITELRLGNFKAFAETQKIPIKPLTLIFGPNSSGKSSLIHGIALANQAIEVGDLDVYRTRVGGEAIDLGGFRQYVHGGRKAAEYRFVEWGIDLDVSKLTGRIAELLAPVKNVALSVIYGIHRSQGDTITVWGDMKDRNELIAQADRRISIRTCEITCDGKTLIRASYRKDNVYGIDTLDPEHPVLKEIFNAIASVYTTAVTFNDNDYEGLKDAIADLLDELTIRMDKFLPRQVLKNGAALDSKPSLLATISKGSRKEDLANATKSFLPTLLNELIQELSTTIESEIKRFQYLGPLRSYPPRHIAFSQHEDSNWFAGGGYAWDIARKDLVVRKIINWWLGNKDRLSTPYELTIRHLLTIDDLDDNYANIIGDIEQRFTEGYQDEQGVQGDLFGDLYGVLEELKNSEARISDVQELNLVDLRTNTVVSHRDVGIGISQVLPVLVAVYASKDKIIAIEQPEIHLHPRLQAELGDVFIETALGKNKNTYILETHSEHFILRILRRIRETASGELPEGHQPIKPSDVAVIYAEPTEKGTLLKVLRITDDGEFADRWPGGFFAERSKELF